ncbi:hypothetical protein C7M84_014773 [Penaeus vannamei]|uniref:Uncharacterized protein n=1 Tax=Penaeus vannamei TaxID=6689 RepID=A0A423SSK8_PENVA|nr:hypothetical protein C7M84_014773 [Penaeus vannamei]
MEMGGEEKGEEEGEGRWEGKERGGRWGWEGGGKEREEGEGRWEEKGGREARRKSENRGQFGITISNFSASCSSRSEIPPPSQGESAYTTSLHPCNTTPHHLYNHRPHHQPTPLAYTTPAAPAYTTSTPPAYTTAHHRNTTATPPAYTTPATPAYTTPHHPCNTTATPPSLHHPLHHRHTTSLHTSTPPPNHQPTATPPLHAATPAYTTPPDAYTTSLHHPCSSSLHHLTHPCNPATTCNTSLHLHHCNTSLHQYTQPTPPLPPPPHHATTPPHTTPHHCMQHQPPRHTPPAPNHRHTTSLHHEGPFTPPAASPLVAEDRSPLVSLSSIVRREDVSEDARSLSSLFPIPSHHTRPRPSLSHPSLLDLSISSRSYLSHLLSSRSHSLVSPPLIFSVTRSLASLDAQVLSTIPSTYSDCHIATSSDQGESSDCQPGNRQCGWQATFSAAVIGRDKRLTITLLSSRKFPPSQYPACNTTRGHPLPPPQQNSWPHTNTLPPHILCRNANPTTLPPKLPEQPPPHLSLALPFFTLPLPSLAPSLPLPPSPSLSLPFPLSPLPSTSPSFLPSSCPPPPPSFLLPPLGSTFVPSLTDTHLSPPPSNPLHPPPSNPTDPTSNASSHNRPPTLIYGPRLLSSSSASNIADPPPTIYKFTIQTGRNRHPIPKRQIGISYAPTSPATHAAPPPNSSLRPGRSSKGHQAGSRNPL